MYNSLIANTVHCNLALISFKSAKGERAVDKPNFERGNNIFGLGRSRFGSNSNSDVETGSNGNGVSNKLLPTLRQFFPGANKNFGFRSGEGKFSMTFLIANIGYVHGH